MYLDFTAMENCLNPASYGEICVSCNACGRIDKETQNEAEIKLYEELLEENLNFDGWAEGWEETQRKNVAAKIEYYRAKIKELKAIK